MLSTWEEGRLRCLKTLELSLSWGNVIAAMKRNTFSIIQAQNSLGPNSISTIHCSLLLFHYWSVKNKIHECINQFHNCSSFLLMLFPLNLQNKLFVTKKAVSIFKLNLLWRGNYFHNTRYADLIISDVNLTVWSDLLLQENFCMHK